MSRLPARGLVALAAASMWPLTGCGAADEAPVDEELRSSLERPFQIVVHDGARHVVGHGVTLPVPDGWTGYEPETESRDGTTYEWAVGLPVRGDRFPPGLQLSMGKPGTGPGLDDLPAVARGLAERSAGYELVGEGEVDVPGARAAAYLRFVRHFAYGGELVRLEQVTLMLEVADGTTSTIRFLAPEENWDEQVGDAYSGVAVAVAAGP